MGSKFCGGLGGVPWGGHPGGIPWGDTLRGSRGGTPLRDSRGSPGESSGVPRGTPLGQSFGEVLWGSRLGESRGVVWRSPGESFGGVHGVEGPPGGSSQGIPPGDPLIPRGPPGGWCTPITFIIVPIVYSRSAPRAETWSLWEIVVFPSDHF